MLRAQLEAEGHVVFEAHDGVDALALLERQRVDVVISDILMPKMDGYRLCHEIRKHARLHDLPIILYTSTYTSPSDEKLVLDVGADKYLKKPASVETLVAALHEVIAKPHAGPRPEALQEIEVLKEYSERLVSKLAEKNSELITSEVKFRTLVEQSIVGIYIIQDDQFVYVNPRMAEIFGWSEEEMTSRTLYDFIVPEDHALVRENIRKQTSGKVQNIHYYLRMLHQSGAVLQVEIHGNQTDYNGRPAVMGMLVDITGRKQAEECLASQYALLRAIINSSGDVIVFSLDAQYCYTAFNDKHRLEMKKVWSIDVQIGMNMLDCMNIPEFRALAKQSMDRALRGESFLEEQYQANVNIYYEFNWNPVMQGKDVVGVAVFTRDITGRKQTEEALRESESKYRLLIDNASESIVVAQDGLLKFVNPAALDLLGGYSEQEVINRPFPEFIHPDDRNMVVENYRRRMAKDAEQLAPYAFRVVTHDGIVKWVEINATLIEWQGKPATLNFLAEITERKQAEEETQRERAFFDRLVETAPEGIAISDTQGRVLRVNAEFVRMFGYGVDEVVGQCLDDLVAPPARQEEARALTASATQGSEILLETVRHKKDGTLVDVSLISAPILVAGKQEAVYAIYRDITGRKQAEQKLEEMATHDPLTGLPNRRLLLDRFTIAAALAHRNKDRIAVMSLDLDNFKSINDTFGHDTGDQILKVISTRLVRILRASDTFARVGGDEFISLMMETDHIEGATAIAQKILDSFTEPLSIAGHQLHLSTSIGLAIYPEDGEDLETLTKKSDAAMYYSKSHGRNQFKFYGDDDVRIG